VTGPRRRRDRADGQPWPDLGPAAPTADWSAPVTRSRLTGGRFTGWRSTSRRLVAGPGRPSATC